MADNAIEIFKLRREHKMKKKLAEKKNQVTHDKKPVLKMQLQE